MMEKLSTKLGNNLTCNVEDSGDIDKLYIETTQDSIFAPFIAELFRFFIIFYFNSRAYNMGPPKAGPLDYPCKVYPGDTKKPDALSTI